MIGSNPEFDQVFAFLPIADRLDQAKSAKERFLCICSALEPMISSSSSQSADLGRFRLVLAIRPRGIALDNVERHVARHAVAAGKRDCLAGKRRECVGKRGQVSPQTKLSMHPMCRG